ncbi:histidine phosphatase superfamily [Boletus reticuloceps]|uniref:Histidine phosphatase superfamily n=1 Tax=Boletus reticuloceps TaxID=495285 RepID=A0A8I2YCP1_9AGAM|nr:histidine phosphatase superfamily [Boletus reticuloceps]
MHHLISPTCRLTADPQLTPLGEQQAWDAHVAWETERRFGIPVPEKLYTSPLTRAIRTSQITFDNLIVCDLRTTINVREQHGIHTCDKRRTRSEIHDAFPEYTFEDGFTEADLLWKPDYRETHADVDRRVTRVLDDIFQNGHEQCRSVSLQRVLGAALRADGPFSYIDHDAWRFRRGILAGVSPLPLVSSHRRAEKHLSSAGIMPVVVKGSTMDVQRRN